MEERKPLLHKTHASSDSNTKVKIMLYVLVHCLAVNIASLTMPQYLYHYLKRLDASNDTNVAGLLKNKSNVQQHCENNSTSPDSKIQGEASVWSWYMSLADKGVGLPLIFLIGPLIDRFGRKPLLIWNTVGVFISYVLRTIVIYMEMPLYYYVSACAVEGLAGTAYGFHLINHAILADITDSGKDRSFSMVLYEAVLGIGAVCTNIGTGYIINSLGYSYPYLITTSGLFLVPVLVGTTLTDTRKPSKKVHNEKDATIAAEICSLCKQKYYLQKNVCKFVSNVIILNIYIFPAASGIRTLYLLGPPFCWTSEHIGWYGAGSDAVKYIVGTVILKIMHTLCVRLKDEVIVVFGLLSYAANMIILGFASSDWMVYEAAAAEALRICVSPLLKAILSRMVDPAKQGVLFLNIYAMEMITTLAGTTAFNNLYDQTVTINRGLTYFVMAGFPVFAIVLVICVNFASLEPKVQAVAVVESSEIQNTYHCKINDGKGVVDSKI